MARYKMLIRGRLGVLSNISFFIQLLLCAALVSVGLTMSF